MTCLVVEHKTTTADITLGSRYWQRTILDTQISQYMRGAESLPYNIPEGVLYDVIRKPSLAPYEATPLEARRYTVEKSRACPECKRKRNATPPPHLVNVSDDEHDHFVQCADGRLVTDPGGRLYADQRELDETPDEWRARLLTDIAARPDYYYARAPVVRMESERVEAARDTWLTAQAIRESARLDAWPRNPGSCEAYGRMCDYWRVCTGEAVVSDPVHYRDSEHAHEELGALSSKRSLPLLTNSAMSTYRSCARRYLYAYVLQRRPVQRAKALTFGTVMHHGLEAWWRTVDLEQAIAAIRAHADDLTVYELVTAECLMRGYHVRWRHEPITVLDVERSFIAPLLNPDTGAASRSFELAGKCDAIAEVEM